MSTTPEELQKAYRAIAAIVVVVLVAGAATVTVRAAYGAFSDDFQVTTRFRRAGQALRPGSDVKYRGVNVGKVRSVELVDREVEVVLQLKPDTEVSDDTEATVRPKTLFGEKYVELSVTDDEPPFLAEGDTVVAAGTGTEVEELLDSADRLLRRVDIDEVATLFDELTQAAQGEGDNVARAIDRGTEAAAVFQDTLDAQLRAVDSLERFTDQYRDIGPSLVTISGNLNDLLPTFNAARADFERLLVTLRPFADRLADFIEVNEADLGQILDNGDNIVRVLTARKENISETIYGLSRYLQAFAGAIGDEQLPDGSRFGYLKVFIEGGNLQKLICNTFGPTGLAGDLAAVTDALAAAVPLLDCRGAGPAAGPPAGDPLAELTDGLVGVVATPDTPGPTGTVGDVLAPALGGGD